MTDNLLKFPVKEQPTSTLRVTRCAVLSHAIQLEDGPSFAVAEKHPPTAYAVVRETEGECSIIALYAHPELAVQRCQEIVADLEASQQSETVQ